MPEMLLKLQTTASPTMQKARQTWGLCSKHCDTDNPVQNDTLHWSVRHPTAKELPEG